MFAIVTVKHINTNELKYILIRTVADVIFYIVAVLIFLF